MSSRMIPEQWNHAVSVLQRYPSEFLGTDVFPVLKFSYDSLLYERDRNCFLYCSIFREGYNIRKDELINLWIGEGLLDEYRNNNIHVTFNRGEFIIGTLKLACLIESDESEEFVRMHDVIRDMALWVANSSGWNKSKILVLHGSEEFVRMQDMICDMALWLVCGDRRDKFLIQLVNSIIAHRKMGGGRKNISMGSS